MLQKLFKRSIEKRNCKVVVSNKNRYNLGLKFAETYLIGTLSMYSKLKAKVHLPIPYRFIMGSYLVKILCDKNIMYNRNYVTFSSLQFTSWWIHKMNKFQFFNSWIAQSLLNYAEWSKDTSVTLSLSTLCRLSNSFDFFKGLF